jgi:hypothetical protein
MADWTNLPNTAVGVGGLPSGTTVTALRDNPVAIAEGAAGAPRIVGRSAATLLEYLTQFPFSGLSPGSFELNDFAYGGDLAQLFGVTSSTFQTACTITITSLATGTFTFVGRQTSVRDINTVNVSTSELRLVKNGTVVQSWFHTAPSNTSGTAITREVDVSAATGDVFEWEIRKSSGPFTVDGGGTNIRVDDNLITVGLPIKRSEERP